MQPNPNWLNDEIRRGLSRLVCLCLDSAPAVDLVEGTAQAWLTALTRGRAWDEQRDAPRVRAAFDTLPARIGSAPGRGSVCQNGEITVVGVTLKKKKKSTH